MRRDRDLKDRISGTEIDRATEVGRGAEVGAMGMIGSIPDVIGATAGAKAKTATGPVGASNRDGFLEWDTKDHVVGDVAYSKCNGCSVGVDAHAKHCLASARGAIGGFRVAAGEKNIPRRDLARREMMIVHEA